MGVSLSIVPRPCLTPACRQHTCPLSREGEEGAASFPQVLEPGRDHGRREGGTQASRQACLSAHRWALAH